MADLSKLQADVAAQTTIIQGVVALLTDLSARITAAGTDPKALADLAASIEANSQALADAVTANTPAPPAPTP